MRKKGQITIFVVIGLVLLIGVGIYFGFKSDVLSQDLNRDISVHQQSQDESVDLLLYDAISSCARPLFKNASLYAVKTRFFTLESGLESNNIPYFYFAGKSLLPSRDLLESQLLTLIEQDLWSCINTTINQTDKFSGQLQLNQTTPLSSSIIISNNKLTGVFTVNGKYYENGAYYSLKDQSVTHESLLGTFYNAVEMMLYPPEREEGELFFDPAFKYLDENDVSASAYSVPPADILFVFESVEESKEEYKITFKFRGVS